ncbi:glutaredoxin family protein [Patescibacteria group bacterium]|nr:glutaredoxin family protein [Patescibacteria group bacterium]
MQKVKIYTSPTCAYCEMAKDWFKEKKIKYKEVDVAKDPSAAAELIKESGQMGVPVIILGLGKDKKVITGFDQGKLEELLK